MYWKSFSGGQQGHLQLLCPLLCRDTAFVASLAYFAGPLEGHTPSVRCLHGWGPHPALTSCSRYEGLSHTSNDRPSLGFAGVSDGRSKCV